jgi:hypothetical protein
VLAILLVFLLGLSLWLAMEIPAVAQVVAESIGPLGAVGLTAIFVVLVRLPEIKRTGRVPRWPLLFLIVCILAAFVFVVSHAVMVQHTTTNVPGPISQ